MSLLARRLAWAKSAKAMAQGSLVSDLSVHILSTFTVDPLVAYLGHALADLFVPALAVGGFDQIVQQFLEPSEELSAANIVIVWPRFEDLWHGDWPLVEGDNTATNERLHEIAEVAVEHTLQHGQTLVFVLPALPQAQPLGVGDAGNRFGVSASATATRESLRSFLSTSPGALVFDTEEVVRTLGIATAFDNRRMAAATIPYTEEAFSLAGERMARLIGIALRGAKKVAVVDADNTLWGGVVGEEGADGIDLADQGPGVSYREFQHYLLALRRAGLLVALASKNNQADAFDAFNRREMVLQQQHLAAWRVDWNAKSGNIAAMADELNLGASSMVFVDDSPMERSEVSSALPDVVTLEMPEDPAGWWATIALAGAFDRLAPTASDLGRAESYSIETKRRVVRSAVSAEEFLAGLELIVSVIDPGPGDIPRFAQLLSKTNQFTLGGERHSESALVSMLDSGAIGRLFAAADRFGDYGVIGAILLREDPSEVSDGDLTLDSFVLSCRAMARGIEDAMLAEAYDLNAQLIAVAETPKNLPARRWLATYGLHPVGTAVRLDMLDRLPQWPGHLKRSAAVDEKPAQ